MNLAALAKNPTVLLSAAGLVVTIAALMQQRKTSAGISLAAGGSGSGGGSAVTAAGLTSQVNAYNADAAAVTRSLIASRAGVESTALGQIGAIANRGIESTANTGAQSLSAMAGEENTLLSAGTHYAEYTAGQRGSVALGTMTQGGSMLKSIESAITSRYASSVAGAAQTYGTEVNALTTQYGDLSAIAGAQIGSYPKEFGSVGSATAAEIGSLAPQAAAETQAQAQVGSSFWNALSKIAGSAQRAYSGGFGGFASSGATDAAPQVQPAPIALAPGLPNGVNLTRFALPTIRQPATLSGAPTPYYAA